MAQFLKEAEFSVASPEPDAVSVSWSPSGRDIAVLAGMLRHVTVFDVPTGRKIGQISDLAGGGRSVAYSHDGRVIVPTRDNGAVTVWTPQTNATITIPGLNSSGTEPSTNRLFNFAVNRLQTRLAGLHFVKQGAGKAI